MTLHGSTHELPVYIVGLGQVGRQLVNDLILSASKHFRLCNLRFRIRGLFDSTGGISVRDSEQFLGEDDAILQWKQDGHSLKEYQSGIQCSIDSMITNFEKNVIVVDTSATEKTIPVLLSAVDSGATIVMANKKPITSSMDVYKKLNCSGFIGIESTVGAGTPILACLERLISSGDQVTFLEGALSGTLGFLASEWDNGKPFSLAVEEAYNLGYTEPDPRDDLSGMDVARKALILGRRCGAASIEMEDISVEPLFHPGLQKLSVLDFLESLSGVDDNFNQKIAAATDNGCVLRYVARIELDHPKGGVNSAPFAKISVGLQEVPICSPLGQLSGTDNLVAFTTSTFDTSPLVVRGKGAGVKASGVIADMVQISKWRHPQF